MFPLDDYLRHIGFSGETDASLDTLRRLHLAHTQRIAFENLTPLSGGNVDLDPAALHHKFVVQGRGGYCFEQNLFFQQVLQTLGFDVSALAARVRWNAPAGAITARSHVLLRVALDDGDYIADVGFGGLTLTAPLRLEADRAQPTPHENFRLRREDDSHVLEAELDGRWHALYAFDLQAQHAIDFEVGNWWVSRHPSSRFVNQLIVARPQPGVRHALVDNHYSERRLGGTHTRRILTSVAQVRGVLKDIFDIDVADSGAIDDCLHRLIARNADKAHV